MVSGIACTSFLCLTTAFGCYRQYIDVTNSQIYWNKTNTGTAWIGVLVGC